MVLGLSAVFGHAALRLLDALAKKDAALAAQIAAEAGLAPKVPAAVPVAAPPPPPLPPLDLVVDSILCAAADACELHPKVPRPALLAAFSRAGRLGASATDVAAMLGGALTASESPAPKAEPGGKGKPR
jgi:hypothetical protein